MTSDTSFVNLGRTVAWRGNVKFGVSYLLQIQKYSKIQPIQGGSFWPHNVGRPNVFQ